MTRGVALLGRRLIWFGPAVTALVVILLGRIAAEPLPGGR
jgi:hypothetical protein